MKDKRGKKHFGGKKFKDLLIDFWKEIFSRELYSEEEKRRVKRFKDVVTSEWDVDVDPILDHPFFKTR